MNRRNRGFSRSMHKFLRLVIIALVVFVTVKVSTFGWRFWGKTIMNKAGNNPELIKNLKLHIYKLSQEIGERSVFQYEKLEQAADYISANLASFGYNVEFQNYTVYDKKVKNIIASKQGEAEPKTSIIVGAHYDTCFNPGADDNASGVAVLLELARFMSDKRLDCTVKFIAFVNEEPPFFRTENMGSMVYAGKAKADGEAIKAAVILESLGYYSDRINSQRYPLFLGFLYPNKGNFIAVVGNLSSAKLVSKLTFLFKKHSDFPVESIVAPAALVPGADFSDNYSFWKKGYPALMVTDTAFFRNPYYHSPSDTYEKIDYEAMAEVAGALSGVLFDFAQKGSP